MSITFQKKTLKSSGDFIMKELMSRTTILVFFSFLIFPGLSSESTATPPACPDCYYWDYYECECVWGCGSGSCCGGDCCYNECCNDVCCGEDQECCGGECCDPDDCCGDDCCGGNETCCGDECCNNYSGLCCEGTNGTECCEWTIDEVCCDGECCNGSCCDSLDCEHCVSGDCKPCLEKASDYEELTGCSGTIVPDPDWTPQPNGCSSPLGDNPAYYACGEASSFLDACNDHDTCYQTCNSSRVLGCDANFSSALGAVCEPLSGDCKDTCNFWADNYAGAVINWGQGAWESGQVNACACCDC